MSDSKKRKETGEDDSSGNNKMHWEDVKKARNRINSQRTRERERVQMETLETDKTRLSLSNDALRYQNAHFRDAIQQIREVQRLRQMNIAVGAESIGGLSHLASGLSRPSTIILSEVPLSSRSQTGFLPSLQQQMRFSGLDRELGQFSSSMHPIGSSSLDDLRIRQQAAMDVEAALLHRHRAAAAGVGGLHPLSHSPLRMTQPTGMHQVPSSQEIMELRARQLRLQELSGIAGAGAAGMMGQLTRGFRDSSYGGDTERHPREDSKQEAKQVDRKERRKRAKR
jgi:hypothetical protein